MSQFVVLEGINGAGKSTVAEELRSAFENRGLSAIAIDAAAMSLAGGALRSALMGDEVPPLVDTLWFAAMRADGIRRFAAQSHQPSVDVVIVERWSLALRAYGAADGLPSDLLDALGRNLDSFLSPSRTFLLDITGSNAMVRLSALEGLNRFESRGSEYLDRVAQHYRRYSDELPGVTILDATASPASLATLALEQIGDLASSS